MDPGDDKPMSMDALLRYIEDFLVTLPTPEGTDEDFLVTPPEEIVEHFLVTLPEETVEDFLLLEETVDDFLLPLPTPLGTAQSDPYSSHTEPACLAAVRTDPGDEFHPETPPTPPDVTTRESDPCSHTQPASLTSDCLHDDKDGQREVKTARLRQIQTVIEGPMIRNWPEPYWRRKVGRGRRRFVDVVRERQERLRFERMLDAVDKEDEKVLAEKAEEGRDLSEIPSQQEPTKSPEDLPRSEIPYCMSDEFIHKLVKNATLYFSMVKETSRKDIIANGFQYMEEEAFLAFRNYIAEKDLFEDFEYKFGEVLHHCFSVEGHRKVYCHYNFTMKIKKNDEVCWTSMLYFAEAKMMCGVKYYFCSPLRETDDGHCYLCSNQGVNELKHPPGGGYEIGNKGSELHYPNADSSDDDEFGLPSSLMEWH